MEEETEALEYQQKNNVEIFAEMWPDSKEEEAEYGEYYYFYKENPESNDRKTLE